MAVLFPDDRSIQPFDPNCLPNEEMTFLERNPCSIWRLDIVFCAPACVLLLATGCSSRTDADTFKSASTGSALSFLLLEGHELHPRLKTARVARIRDLPDGILLTENPHASTDVSFVDSIARGSSQGRLDGRGMRSALYARYLTGESEIGLYGLEAESEAEAIQRELALRGIWEHNASLDRARVHRAGLVVLVLWIWTDHALPECWQAVKARVKQRMTSRISS